MIKPYYGLLIAIFLLVLWATNLAFWLTTDVDWRSAWPYLGFLVQTHLYTGIFITAHDAMHGTVSNNKTLNTAVGTLCAALFALNYYPALNRKHHLHHRFVGTDKDPDYHGGSFWLWYWSFAKQYITWWQILLMAILFNVLSLFWQQTQVAVFWALPSVLATFQLFYFGTFIPHRNSPDNKHKSVSMPKNHFLAFLSCYFFGYHYEHHDSPATPWWKLHALKD